MKLKYPGPFTADFPSLGLVGVEPGAEVDVVDEAAAASLLAQGLPPVDKAAKDLLASINQPTSDPQEA